jgi:hypothetical protein
LNFFSLEAQTEVGDFGEIPDLENEAVYQTTEWNQTEPVNIRKSLRNNFFKFFVNT